MRRWFAALLLLPLAAEPADRLGDIEFFGYKGLDVAKVRHALPVHQGDAVSESVQPAIRRAVESAIGKQPTDIAGVCCDDQGRWLIFIGLPGESYKPFAYNPPPTGAVRLPAEIMDLSSRLDDAIVAAVRKGAAAEDDSNGYALFKDPDARSLQMAIRQWTLNHEPALLAALGNSADAETRRVASVTLGYARRSDAQIRALTVAARDPDDTVRNNATRALGVLVRSDRALASKIPAGTFIAMLSSGKWTDRNKGAMLLAEVTAAKDPQLLAQIRSAALDSLIEMAIWHRAGHAGYARLILGRVAGIPEQRLQELAWKGPVQEIIDAATGH